MKILLVGNHPYDGTNGPSMIIFANVLCSALMDRGHEVVLVRPEPKLWKLAGKGKLGKWCKYIDQFVFFPFQLRRLAQWADVIHICDHSNTPFLDHLTGKPCVVTCHDVIGMKRALGLYPEQRAGWMGRKLQDWTVRNLRKADRIACVSQTSQRELEELLQLRESKLSVVYNGLNYPYAPMDEISIDQNLKPLGLPLDSPYILHVGSDAWTKNRRAVVEIFTELRRLNHPFAGHLVFVGAPLGQELTNYLQEQGLAGDVRSFQNVPSEVLRALYSKAALFLFPSLYEGFGWPIIEAQACGCLVATSNRNPMREISSRGAIHIDPEDPVASARIITKLPLAEQDAIRQLGLENARRFSLESMIDGYETLYKAIVMASENSTITVSA